jgi:glycosyltransferase involved in cell wall biosynthesis
MNLRILRFDRPVARLVQFLRTFLLLKLDKSRLLLHYTPDVSGGAATFILSIAKILPEYAHLIVTNREVVKVIAPLISQTSHLYWLQDSITEQNIRKYGALQPVAIFNHLSWDLKPVKLQWLPSSLGSRGFPPKIISFAHTLADVRKLPGEIATVDLAVVFSRYLEDSQLESALFSGPNASKIRPMPSVFDDTEWTDIEMQGLLRHGRFVVGNITNGAPWKHSQDFINIMDAMGHSCPDAFFCFLGARDLVPLLAGHENVEILMPFSQPVIDYLKTISVLIHKIKPDIIETWCRVVTEAMFAGVPVIAEKRGGIREQIIHGETGFLCETSDDFARYALMLRTDETLYRRIGSQAREFAIAHFGREPSRKRMLELLA